MSEPSPSFDGLIDWLIDGARDCPTAVELIDQLAEKLAAAGVPLVRMALFQPAFTATSLGRGFYWNLGAPTQVQHMSVASGTLREANAVGSEKALQQSPIYEVFRTRKEYRSHPSETAPEDGEYAMIAEFRSKGFTDYLALPLFFRTSETHVVSFGTTHGGGFSAEAIAGLRRLTGPLARIAESIAMEYSTESLLSTYLGARTANRVLSGKVFRGDIEVLRAVIWFSDLRGFTDASSTREPREVIDLLNVLFDCQVPAIEKHGGEVLKFIGDGLLAIFPCPDPATTSEQCAKALAAASEAFAALDSRKDTAVPLNIGLALHVGEVAYGNIGGAARLDFTTIGSAVNLSARLEGLASKLGKKLVVSTDFAKSTNVPMIDLGEHDLKGIGSAQRVFAPG